MNKIYAFAKRGVTGGAFLVAGTNIHEAAETLERLSGHRPIMGNVASEADVTNCDRTYLRQEDL